VSRFLERVGVIWYDFEAPPCDVCGKPVGYRLLAPESGKSYCSLGCREQDRRVGTYNITRRQWKGLLAQQGGRCAICVRPLGREEDQIHPCVDHDHATGRVRGILCRNRNFALGFLEDDPSRAEAAAAIKAVKTTLRPVEISPQNAYLRRLQHQLVAENDLSARSTGKEPQRRLRITPTPEDIPLSPQGRGSG